jgi:RHS repeat-associated protein
MKWTLINPAGTNDPDTGDIYSGLDRFGRVKDNRWLDGAGADLDRLQYGYDRAGNRIWRRNVVAAAMSKEFDELYGYDAIQRLKHMGRGTLNSGRTALTSETFAQCWTLDSTGNWQGFREDDDGNGTWDLIQQRAANPVNEISNISETAGPSWVTPAYSRAGNMTTMPQPADPTESYTATYDAWNRLVKITDGADTVSEYAYDGAKRRIVQKSYIDGILDETRHLYYTQPSQWQVIEERLGTSPDSAEAERQFVWGLRYIDDLVLRDRDTDDNGSLDERLYACQDANWNVTGVVDDDEAVQERYAYSAYGTPVWLSSTFVPQTAAFDWETLYCGYRYESTAGLLHVRNRTCISIIGLWLQRDPIGYDAGTNLYQYTLSAPLTFVDPFGLEGLESILTKIGGLLGGGRCCYAQWRYPPASPFCINIALCGVISAESCCESAVRKTKVRSELCLTVSYGLCQSLNRGMFFWTPFEIRCSPKDRGIPPVGPQIGGNVGSCPPDGCWGRLCIHVMIGGYGFGSWGVRYCYVPGTGDWQIEYGITGPPGTGIGGGGCISCYRTLLNGVA